MNDPTFDNELLSAYLDDELTPEERARVEARLASDPDARKLLDEMRAVSRAMRDLPRETLPGDLSETVLRRAERAMLSSTGSTETASSATSALVELARKIPFGRSARAWAWAGLAVAAGLMIMIFEKKPEGDERMPAVAQREVREINKPMPQLEVRSLEASGPEEHSQVAAVPPGQAPSESEEISGNMVVREGLAAGRPAAVADADASSSRSRSTQWAAPEIPASRFGGGGIGGSAPASAPIASGELVVATDEVAGLVPRDGAEPELPASSDSSDVVDLLVVHVNVKPEAIKQKLIDGVLARNGIVVEEAVEAAAAGSEVASEPESSSAAPAAASAGYLFEESKADAKKAAPNVDVLLVEAEPQQILSCLSEIDADRTNYLGIAVDDQTEAAGSISRQPEHDWNQHDRGYVPQRQRLQIAADNHLYLETNGQQVVLPRAGVDPTLADKGSPELDASNAGNRGRALRVQVQPQTERFGALANQSSISGKYASPELVGIDHQTDAGKWGIARRSMQKLATKANTLQVLFVLSAGDEAPPPASSPPADNSLP